MSNLKLKDFWDPLSPKVEMSAEIYASTLKREIKNIIKSYTGWFDPLSEMIQNALDAVDERAKQAKNYNPKIWIEINLNENSICVTDNGIGFTPEQFHNFLRPNVSFKGGGTRGDKGVGATYLAYGFNYLQIGTKTPDFQYLGELTGGREWVEDTMSVKTRPTVKTLSKPYHSSFDQVDQGSTFCLKLVGEYIRPRDLEWLGADKCPQWEAILRTKTPLGGIYLDRARPSTICELKVVRGDGQSEERTITECEYLYPHKVIPTCVNLTDIVNTQKKQAQQGGKIHLPPHFSQLDGIYAEWRFGGASPSEDPPLQVDKTDHDMLTKYRVCVYGFFTYSTDVWDDFNDNVVGLRKGKRLLLDGGLQMAANAMPQGELTLIPLTRNVYYQTVTHVVVHFALADPDLGRKGFQPELESLAKRVSAAAVGKFEDWRLQLKKSTGAPPKIIQDKDIHDWKVSMEQHEKDEPLVINRQDVFLPTKEVALTGTPILEQDVIVLFNQLLAGGVIRGIKLMATSPHEKYDGLYRAYLRKPFEPYLFDKEKNPLGVQQAPPSEYLSAPYVIEYKYSFDSLLDDFEAGAKDPHAIDLVVCWTMGHSWKKRYRVTPLLHLSNIHLRDVHGVTHLIQDSTTGQHAFMAVVLNELIDYINNPDGVQGYQKTTYMI